MCLAVYISSDIELPTIPFDGDKQQISIELVSREDFEAGIDQQFSKKYIYYVGSHTYCGCGFIRDKKHPNTKDEYEQKEYELSEKDIDDLVMYLKSRLEETNELEMFVCWQGEQSYEPEERNTINPEDLKKIYFKMTTLEFFKIIKY